MVKGQVLAGGRGKAGAIKAVSSKAEAESAARQILAMRIKDYPVQKVLVTEQINIRQEYYLGITIDREKKAVVLILSTAGGMDIEEVAVKEPRKIKQYVMGQGDGNTLSKWLLESFSDELQLDQMVAIIEKMYRLFREKDCSLVEINPLALTEQNELIAADAKIVFDDNAISQHPELAELSNPEQYTPDEHLARAAGLSFVSLTGQIGCMVNGAGLAMATMDGIKLAGGNAANFLDVGGSSNPNKVLHAMRILVKNEQLKVILINIFGGITRCDDIAQGILWASEQLDISVPIVIRLIGTNEKKGRDMLRKEGLIAVRNMTEAIVEAVRCAEGGRQ